MMMQQLAMFSAPEYAPRPDASARLIGPFPRSGFKSPATLAPIVPFDAPPMPERKPEPEGKPIVVYLVGCGKSKARRMSRAKELYTGGLFQAARRHAEQRTGTWRILSAKYGILNPEKRIKPYDQRLSSRQGEREMWARSVASGLSWELGSKRPNVDNGVRYEVVILAGEDYACPLAAILEGRGIKVSRPLAGMGLGKRLAWFKAQAAAA